MTTETREIPLREAEDCPACAERIRARLETMEGIAAVEVETPPRRLRVTYDPAVLRPGDIELRAREAGAAIARRFRHATLRLEGLDCPECAGAVEHSVGRLPGVLHASANFAAASLHVEYDSEATDLPRVAEAVARAGYRALLPGAVSDALLVRVPEMDCQEEVRAIEGRLRTMPGVSSWQVNLLERTLRVQFDPAAVGPEAILAAIRGLGMTAEPADRAPGAVSWRRDPLLLSAAASRLLLAAALALD